MGKFLDFILANNWEEYQRIQLYKKIGENLTKEEFIKLIKQKDEEE